MATCVRWARGKEVILSIGTSVLVSMASVVYPTVPIYTLFKGSRQIVDRSISWEYLLVLTQSLLVQLFHFVKEISYCK